MTPTTLQIFDTMTGKKRPFEPLVAGKVSMYVCGVTVYDLMHIGHGRTFSTFDVVARYLRYRGYDVTYVRNHTDIDDKIIKRANENGEDPLALAERFIVELDADMEAMGNVPPDHAPRVSGHIDEIITMTQQLIDNGHAYAVDGDVYYAVESFDGYGKLSGRKLEDMRAGERVTVDKRKRNPFDFALWKTAKPDEPFWESPWGPGRPGWHIECSAMSTKVLGNHFDIHGGGSDLVFPHHENEIAQAEGATGCSFANYWMHSAMLNIDGEKMGKSLGNFWTVRDVLKQYHPETIRYFLLTAHYRKPVNYSLDNLELARNRVQYLHRTRQGIEALWKRVDRPERNPATYDGYLQSLHEGMDDDFNSPISVAIVGEAAKKANELLTTKKLVRKVEVLAQLAAIEDFMSTFAGIFGVLERPSDVVLDRVQALLIQQLNIDTAEVDVLVAQRTAARASKDWAEADRVRDVLLEKQIEVLDTADGTVWRVVTGQEG